MKKRLGAVGVFAVILTGCGSGETVSEVPVDTSVQEQAMEEQVMMEKEVADKAMMESEEKMAEASTTTVVDGVIGSPDHTTLVAAVKAADLVDTLSGAGPFTVFAPVNSAFEKLPEGTVETLLKPESKSDLAGILTYHVVASKAMSGDVVKMITDGGGSATVPTVQGGHLTLQLDGEQVTVTDENGGVATVTAVDLEHANGVIHVIDSVLLPAA